MIEQPQMRDYVRWHEAYDDPESSLSLRLRHVQLAIGAAYDAHKGSVRVLSSCAGQGADLLGVLDARPELRARTTGALIELHPTNAAIARDRIADLGVDLQVVEADASVSTPYVDWSPADLVLLSGIMGNIGTDDVERLVRASPQFCAHGATVIWTRGSQTPDIGPEIRRWFAESGFEEVSYDERLGGTSMRVGVNRYVGEPQPSEPGTKLFTFVR